MVAGADVPPDTQATSPDKAPTGPEHAPVGASSTKDNGMPSHYDDAAEREKQIKADIAEAARDEDDPDINPKTLIGMYKPGMSAVPGVALFWCGMGMLNGMIKYGKFNWRKKKVPYSIYIDAAERHLEQFKDGETYAEDSKVHHLGHVMACCAIMLDAEAGGHAIDDRGITNGATSKLIEEYTAKLPDMIKLWKEQAEAKKNANV